MVVLATTLAGARAAHSAPAAQASAPSAVAATPRGCELKALKKATRQQATRCAKATEDRLYQSERNLERVVRDRALFKAQIRDLRKDRVRIGAQLRALRARWAVTARENFKTGSPTSVASIVSTSNAEDLLEKLVTSQYLAERDRELLRDLNGLDRAWAAATETLGTSERRLAAAERRAKLELDQAQKLSDDWLNTLEVLRARNITIPRQTGQTGGGGGVATGGGGGLCDLSGVPVAARELIMRESGGNPYADNPTSTAFGLGQLLLDNRVRFLGDDYATTDCGRQYDAFSQYALGRYGSFENAWAFWQSHHYY
jgi:hypothetical protein